MDKQSTIDEPTKARIPKSTWFIISSELSERFSYFGMRSILSIFLLQQFFNPHNVSSLNSIAEAKSNAYTHAFSTLIYFAPVLGAILADWFFGKYRVILIGSIIYTFGHFILSVSTSNLAFFSVGITTIAVAAGIIKSCTAANVGDQFDRSNQHLMNKAYGWYYFSVNAGGSAGILLIPVLYRLYGPSLAFGVPGILMALATLIFFSGSTLYVKVPATGVKKDNFISVNFYTLRVWFRKRNNSNAIWTEVESRYGIEKTDAVKAVWRIIAVFAFIPIFWGMWDMCQSEWVLQAQKLDLNLGFWGLRLLASQVQVANGLFLLVMIVVFNYLIYPGLEKMGIKLTPLSKIGAGLFVTGLSFVVIALLQTDIQHANHPSVWWQILAYAILSCGEVLVAVTGLEYAYTQAPPSMKSTMTAIWFLTYSVGTFFTTLVNVNIAGKGVFSYFTGDRYFYLFSGIMFFFFLLFLFVSPRIKEKAYMVK